MPDLTRKQVVDVLNACDGQEPRVLVDDCGGRTHILGHVRRHILLPFRIGADRNCKQMGDRYGHRYFVLGTVNHIGDHLRRVDKKRGRYDRWIGEMMAERMSNKTYLWFECGARLPATGYLPEPWTPLAADVSSSGPRKKDGRYKYVVYDSHAERDSISRPVMPDGKVAQCLFQCPARRASGRQEERCFPEDEERLRKLQEAKHVAGRCSLWRWIVTCYPKEVSDDVNQKPVSREAQR